MEQIMIDTLLFGAWFVFAYLVIRFMPTSDKTYKKD